MTFKPKTWSPQDEITSANLNRIEKGIVDANNMASTSVANTFTEKQTFSKGATGDLSGNSDTTTKLKTPVTINGTSFDGTKSISVRPVTFLSNDASTLKLSGTYFVTGNNLPSTGGFYITVIPQNNNVIYQTAVRDYDLKKFERTSDENGDFPAWQEIVFRDENVYSLVDYGGKSFDMNFDNGAIINDIIDKIPENGGTILIPEGDFWIKTPIKVNKNYVTIRGNNTGFRSNIDAEVGDKLSHPGAGSHVLLNTDVDTAITIGESGKTPRISGITIDSINIQGARERGATKSQIGINIIQNNDGIIIKNNVIMNLNYGLIGNGCDAISISNNWICELQNSVQLLNSSQQALITNNYFGAQPSGITLKLDSAMCATISGNNIYPDGFSNIELNNCVMANISGNNIQSYYAGIITINGGNNNLVTSNMIYAKSNGGNWVNDPLGRDNKFGIIQIAADSTTISSNHIISEQPVDATRILVKSGNDVTISSNTILGNSSNSKVVCNGANSNNVSVLNSVRDSEFDSGGNGNNKSFYGNNVVSPLVEQGSEINPRIDKFANNFHLNNPLNTMMNDIQTGFWDGNKWHLYYLYNADISWGGNGTEWYHVTTTDWVEFKNEGVAIPKYKTGWGDIATGTMWEDGANIVGKGAGAKFAAATGYGGDKGQNTMLYYSTDGGYNYVPYQDTPIMNHPDGQTDFRDPFLFYMDGKFILYHAENDKFGVYVSDKINEGYVYKGSYNAPHGMLECPNLFVMNVNGDVNNQRWVCIYSGNGGDDMQTGMYASVGHLDSNYVFQSEQDDIRIDWGPDFYAAKPFADLTASDVHDHLLMVGWLGSWGYVNDVPRDTRKGVGGSSCRIITLTTDNGKYDIKSGILGLDQYIENPIVGNNLKTNIRLPMFKGDSFYIKVRLKNMMDYKGDVSVKFTGNGYDATFTYYLDNQNASVHRYNASFTNNAIFNKDHTFPINVERISDLWLEFFVDRTVIEAITPDKHTYTMAKFPNGRSREVISVLSSADCNFDYEYYQISKEGNTV